MIPTIKNKRHDVLPMVAALYFIGCVPPEMIEKMAVQRFELRTLRI